MKLKIVLIAAVAAMWMAFALPIELEVRSILDNKVVVKIPKDFTIMEKDILKVKYPGPNRPTLVYTNDRGSINVAFNHTTSRASQEMIPTFKDVLKQAFKATQKSAEFISDGVVEINGRKVGYFELMTEAVDTKVYNRIFFTDLEGRLLLCTFNCTEKNIDEWKSIGKEIFESLKIN